MTNMIVSEGVKSHPGTLGPGLEYLAEQRVCLRDKPNLTSRRLRISGGGETAPSFGDLCRAVLKLCLTAFSIQIFCHFHYEMIYMNV